MSSRDRRDVAHRILLWALALLLVVISVWCVTLLLRSFALRQDLDVRQTWIEDLHRARQELERPVAELAERGRWPVLDALRGTSEEIYARADNAPLRQAVRRLQSSLEQLQQALASDVGEPPAAPPVGMEMAPGSGPGDASSNDRIWDASFAVLKASSALEEQIQTQVVGSYQRLDELWRSLNGLVVVCLLLCASNLALLQLAHRRRGQLEQARDRALDLASHDSLTELWNREAILRMMRRELARAARSGTPMGLILADLDDFRQVNSLVGQEQGDTILKEVANRLGALLRPYDMLGRFGGDSFLVLLPTCDQVASRSVAERLAHAVNDTEVEYGLGRLGVSITQVVGVVDTTDPVDADLIIHRLHEALAETQDDPATPTIRMLGPLVSTPHDRR